MEHRVSMGGKNTGQMLRPYGFSFPLVALSPHRPVSPSPTTRYPITQSLPIHPSTPTPTLTIPNTLSLSIDFAEVCPNANPLAEGTRYWLW